MIDKVIRVVVDGDPAKAGLDKISTSLDKLDTSAQRLLDNLAKLSKSSTVDKLLKMSDSGHKVDKQLKTLNRTVNKTTESVNKSSRSLSVFTSKVSKLWRKLGHMSPLRAFNKALRSVGMGVKFIVAQLAGFGLLFNAIIKANNLFTTFHATMLVVVKDAVKVEKEWSYVTNLANKLGVTITGVAEPYARLRAAMAAVDPAGKIAQNMFEGLSTAAVVLHKSAYDTNLMFLAMEQMGSKGKVTLEELQKQLAQKLPGAMTLASEAAGFGKNKMFEFYRAVKSGHVDFANMMSRFGPLIKKTYGSGLKFARNQFVALTNSLGNVWTELGVKISQSGFMEGLNNIIRATIDLFNDGIILDAVSQIGYSFEFLFNQFADWIRTVQASDIVSVFDTISSTVKEAAMAIGQILGVSKSDSLAESTNKVIKLLGEFFILMIKGMKAVVDYFNDKKIDPSFKIGTAANAARHDSAGFAPQGFDYIRKATQPASDTAFDKRSVPLVVPQDVMSQLSYLTNGIVALKDSTDNYVELSKRNPAVANGPSPLNIPDPVSTLGSAMNKVDKSVASFVSSSAKVGQDAITIAIRRREDALKSISDLEKEILNVTSNMDEAQKKTETNIARLAKYKEFGAALKQAKADIMRGSNESLAVLREAAAKKADQAQNFFNKSNVSQSDNLKIQLEAEKASLKARYDANKAYARDSLAFEKSYGDATVRLQSKYLKLMTAKALKMPLTPVDQSSEQFKTLKANEGTAGSGNLEATFQIQSDQMAQRENELLALATTEQQKADIRKAFADAEIARIQEYNDTWNQIYDDNEALKLEKITAAEQAAIDLKSSFGSMASSNQITDLKTLQNNMLKFGKAYTEIDKSTMQGKLQIADMGMKAVSGLMESHNRRLFEIGKAAAIADAVISTIVAVMKAWKDYGWPVGAAIGAGITVAGALNVAKIASTKMGGGSSGGIASGSASTPSGGGSSTPPAPTPVNVGGPATTVSVYVNGVISQDQLTGEIIPAALRDLTDNKDVVLFGPQSAQAQVMNG